MLLFLLAIFVLFRYTSPSLDAALFRMQSSRIHEIIQKTDTHPRDALFHRHGICKPCRQQVFQHRSVRRSDLWKRFAEWVKNRIKNLSYRKPNQKRPLHFPCNGLFVYDISVSVKSLNLRFREPCQSSP